MNGKYKLLVKDTAIFAIGSFGSKVILFFLVPLYTNFLTTEEYGTAELVSTFTQLLVPFTAVVINQALIRFGMKKAENPEDVVKASFVVLLFSVITTIILTPLVGMYRPVREWRWYLAIQIILTNFSEVERSYLKVKNKNRIFAIISILQTLILAISNIVLLTVLRMGVHGYLLANIIALAFVSLITFFAAGLWKDLHRGKYNPALMKKMLAYSFPLILSNVSWWIIHSSDKIMIEWMIGASLLGIYTAATKIPSLINVIISIFNQAWGLSSIREIESSNDSTFYVSVFNLYSTVLFGTSIIITSFVKPFMGVYVGENFKEAWQYTPLLLSAAVFYSIAAFIGTLYAAIQKTRNDMCTSLICAIVNIVVNYIGIRLVGVWGAAIGTLVAYFTIAVIRIYNIKRYLSFNFNLSKYWLNTALMMIHAILVAADWNVLPVSAIIFILYMYINRSYILECFKKAISIKNNLKKT